MWQRVRVAVVVFGIALAVRALRICPPYGDAHRNLAAMLSCRAGMPR